MKTKIKFEGQIDFRRQMLKFASALNLTVKEAVVVRATQTARALATQTEPMGLNAKAKKISSNAISGDFHRVYLSRFHIHHLMRSKSKRRAAAYMNAIMNNRLSEAERLATSTLGANIIVGNVANIQNQRNFKGRIPQARKSVIVEDFSVALAYKKELMESMAMSKGAWLAIAQQLKPKGSRKPNKWLRKDKKYGTATIKGEHLGTVVIMDNHIRYSPRILKASKIARALKGDLKAFARRMDKTIEAANRKK